MRKIFALIILVLSMILPLVRANPIPPNWNPYRDIITFFALIILGVAFVALMIYLIRKKGIHLNSK